MDNPLNNIVPDFTIFGTEYTAIWQKLAAGLWGLGILIAIGYLGHGILGIAQNRGGHPGNLRESKKEAVNAGVALAGLICLAVIIQVFITIFG
jgi:hypothetical protein